MYHAVVFIQSTAFVRRLFRLDREADDVLRRIESDLQADPERGDLVPGLGGIRKARVADPSRGKAKRGGLRYLYLYLETRAHIHLLLLYSKDEQADLTKTQRDDVRRLAEILKNQE